METDWSALLKAVFGSAYLISDLINYPDSISISACRRRYDSYAAFQRHPRVGCRVRNDPFPTVGRACAVSPVEGAWSCDLSVASFPVFASAAYEKTSSQSCAQMSQITPWNVVPDTWSENVINAEGVNDRRYLPVCHFPTKKLATTPLIMRVEKQNSFLKTSCIFQLLKKLNLEELGQSFNCRQIFKQEMNVEVEETILFSADFV